MNKMIDLKRVLLFLLAVFAESRSLQVYSRSILPDDQNQKVGLRYSNSQIGEGPILTNGITICVRFNYQRLGTGDNVLFNIGKSKAISLSFNLRWNVKNNLPNLGGVVVKQNDQLIFYLPWIGEKNYLARYAYIRIWHHMCIALDTENSRLQLVFVSVHHSLLIS